MPLTIEGHIPQAKEVKNDTGPEVIVNGEVEYTIYGTPSNEYSPSNGLQVWFNKGLFTPDAAIFIDSDGNDQYFTRENIQTIERLLIIQNGIWTLYSDHQPGIIFCQIFDMSKPEDGWKNGMKAVDGNIWEETEKTINFSEKHTHKASGMIISKELSPYDPIDE